MIDAFSRRRVIGCCIESGELGAQGAELHRAERELVALLRSASSPRRSPPALRAVRGGGRTIRPPGSPRPAGATAKPLRRAARSPER